MSLSKTVVVLCSELSISDQNQLTQSACKPLKNGIEYKFLNASELDCELENHCTGNRTGGGESLSLRCDGEARQGTFWTSYSD